MDGLVATDSLEMGALAQSGHPVPQAAAEALKAGADLRSSSGTIDVESSAAVLMSDTSLITSAGHLRVVGATNVTLGGLLTTSNASVIATSGSIATEAPNSVHAAFTTPSRPGSTFAVTIM